MNHVVLFAYILNVSFGAAGVVSMAILHHRLRKTVTLALLVIMSGIGASLFYNLIIYYMSTVIGFPATLNAIQYGIGFLITLCVYGGVVILLFALDSVNRKIAAGASAAVMLVQIGRIFAGLFGSMEFQRAARFPALAAISGFLFYVGFVVYRGSQNADDGTVTVLLRRLGILLLIFAPVSVAGYFLMSLFPEVARLRISFDYPFFLAWSIIVVTAFIRHLSRPATVFEGGVVADGFKQTYGITPREAEVIEYIGRGLSNQDIADSLHVSLTTIRTHIYNIFRKTDVKSRVELLKVVSGFKE